MNQENRKNNRAAFVEKITLITSEEKIYAAQSENLSMGGIFVVSQTPLAPGAQGLLNLTVNVEGLKKDVSTKFRVVHNQRSQNGSEGMGLEFLTLSEQDQAVLNQVIQ
jgi:c-di-GMP-binding flagellar brake protein YcgR